MSTIQRSLTNGNYNVDDRADGANYQSISYDIDQAWVSGFCEALIELRLSVNGQSRMISMTGSADDLLITNLDGQSEVILNSMSFNSATIQTVNGNSALRTGAVAGRASFISIIDGRSSVAVTATSVTCGDRIDGGSIVEFWQTDANGATLLKGRVDGQSVLRVNCSGKGVYFDDRIDGGSQVTIENTRTDGTPIFVEGPELSGNSQLTLIGDVIYRFGQIIYGGRVAGGTPYQYPMAKPGTHPHSNPPNLAGC